MADAPRIGFICGSLREGSINQKLSTALQTRVVASGANAIEINLGDYDLPIYHGDLAPPDDVKRLSTDMKACDGIIVITPEYNGSLTPLLKNAIDWTSTTGTDQFTKPIYGVASCSPGPMSGIMVMRQLTYILMRVGAHVVPTQCGTGNAAGAFDADGNLVAEPSSTMADKMVRQILARLS